MNLDDQLAEAVVTSFQEELQAIYRVLCDIEADLHIPRGYRKVGRTTSGGAAPNLYAQSDTHAIPRSRIVQLSLYDNNVFIQLRNEDSMEWGDELEYAAPALITLSINASGIRLRAVGAAARYEVRSWF